MLRGLFTCKKGEVAGGWRKLHYQELHKLFSASNVIRVMKSRRVNERTFSMHWRDEKCIHCVRKERT
jgi:hypothetical protein